MRISDCGIRKELNHRGRRARRGKDSKKLKGRGQGEETIPFSSFSEILRLQRGIHGRNIASSASQKRNFLPLDGGGLGRGWFVGIFTPSEGGRGTFRLFKRLN